MSTAFEIPEWLFQAPLPPTPVDDHRVEALVNHFIAGKQEALFMAPDAFYRLQGADAVQGQPAIADRLQALRAATLDLARDEGERAALEPRLDLHIDDASDGIDRHVVEQQRVYQRQVVSQRQALIQRAAELEHDNDDKIMGLAEANATAAGERAQMDGVATDSPEAAAILGARSSILRTAIYERIANGKGAQALALFDRVKDQLAPADRLSLDTPVQATRNDELANQWIARQSNTDGPPLQQRVEADTALPPEVKPIIRAKVDARESASESARAAKVQALDDELHEAARVQVLNPNAYRPGTFARLADAYDAAGAPDRATFARRMAAQDAFIMPFAQASVEKQQRMIDERPTGDLRDSAIAVKEGQDQAFEHDAFGVGTAIYKEVGAPVPIDDVEGRVRQARQISRLRDGIAVVPFTVREIDDMRRTLATGSEADKEDVRARLGAIPADMRPSIEPQDGSAWNGSMPTFSVQAAPPAPAQPDEDTGEANGNSSRGGQTGSPAIEPPPGSPEYQVAEAQARALDKPSYDDLRGWGKVKVEAKRILAEGESRGATYRVESALQRWERTQELLNDPNIQDDVIGKRYLLRNRNVAADLAAAASQLVSAQRKLNELPSSDALRQLFEVRSVAEAATLLGEKGDKIASAAGLGSLPALTAGIVATAILGPLGGGLLLTETSGLDGYTKGLVGALTRRGIDVTNPDRLVAALLNKKLMEKVRKDARTDGAIEAGFQVLAMAAGGVRFRGKVPRLTKAEQISAKSAKATASEGEAAAEGRLGEESRQLTTAEQASAKSAKGTASEGEEAEGVRFSEEPSRLTAAKRIATNYAKGRAWEKEFRDHFLKNESKYYLAEQVLVKPKNGPPVRIDFVVMDKETKEIFLIDPKDVKRLRLRQPNQIQSFPEIGESGGVIMSKGRPGPGAEGIFPIGKVLPPTKVQIQTRSGAYYASRPAGGNRVSLKRWDAQSGRFDDIPTQP